MSLTCSWQIETSSPQTGMWWWRKWFKQLWEVILESGALKTKDPKTISQEALAASLTYSSGLKKKKMGWVLNFIRISAFSIKLCLLKGSSAIIFYVIQRVRYLMSILWTSRHCNISELWVFALTLRKSLRSSSSNFQLKWHVFESI